MILQGKSEKLIFLKYKRQRQSKWDQLIWKPNKYFRRKKIEKVAFYMKYVLNIKS